MNLILKCMAALGAVLATGAVQAVEVTYDFTGVVTLAQGIYATSGGQSVLGDTVSGSFTIDYAAANQLTGTVGSAVTGWTSTSSFPGNYPGGSPLGQVNFFSTAQVLGTSISYATSAPDPGGDFSTSVGGNPGGSPFSASEQAYHASGLSGSFIELGGGSLTQPSYDANGLPVFQAALPPGAQFGGFKINDQTANLGVIQYNLRTVAAVPEPATVSMLLVGLLMLGVVGRQRRRVAPAGGR